MPNRTSTSHFLLQEFSAVRELQILQFFVFLTLYLIAIVGNFLIITLVILDHHLQTHMYFFLMNLALMDVGSISVIVPKSMAYALINSRTISYSGCIAQVFFYVFFAGSDVVLLAVMAHDRYVAICKPLQYEAIMNKGACIQMAISAWMVGVFFGFMHTSSTFVNNFCLNAVDQFFCEVPKLLRLSCSELYLVEVGFLVLACCTGFGCFIFIITTYISIFTAVHRFPSEQRCQKALSTCLPHLIVVCLLVVTGMFEYTIPPSSTSSDLDLGFAVIYTIFPPMLNPFIYSMRNKVIHTALWKIFHRKHFKRNSELLL